jgi:PAS domain S-box-containing protein
MKEKATILVIDDMDETLSLLDMILTQAGYGVQLAESGESALATVAAAPPDIILLDIHLMDMDGLEVCRRLKADEKTRHIPVILISAFAEAQEWIKGLQLGAADYITKPLYPEELLARVKTHLDLSMAHITLAQQAEALRQANRQLQNEIKECRVLEAELRESEDKFKYFFENSVSGMSITLPSGEVNVNQAFCLMLGYSQEEIKNRRWQDFSHPGDVEFAQKLTTALLAGEKNSVRFIKRYLHKNGSVVWADVGTSLRRDNFGRPQYFITTVNDISERRLAEEKLQTSENKFSIFFNKASLPLVVSQLPEHSIVDVNEAWVQLFGYQKEEAIGKTSLDLGIIRDIELRTRIVDAIQAKESISNIEQTLLTRSGEAVTVLANINTIEIAGQDYALSSLQDITERKRAESALRESEENFRMMIETIPLAIYLSVGIEQKAIYLNPKFYQLFGYALEEVSCADKWWPLVYPDEEYRRYVSEEWNRRVAQAIETQIPIEPMEVEITCKDGSKKNILWGYISLQNKSYAFGIDQTELKKAEHERMRFLHIMESSLNEIYVFDSESLLFEYVNHGALRNLGYALETMRSLTPIDLKPEFTEASFRRTIEPLLRKDQEILIFETVHRRADGSTYPVEVHLQLVEIEGQRVFLAVIMDISERKRVEEEKEKLESRLQQAQKMESVGRLAGGVAHDFNNMLSVILGFTEVAMGQTSPEQPLYADLEEIRRAAERSADLTRQLLAFARKQAIFPRELDLNETVEGILNMLRRLIGEDIHLTWLPGAGLWPINMDPSQIDQILANLSVNARDAIAGVGEIRIATETVVVDEAYCAQHSGFMAGEYVVLSVQDNGCGMNEETLANIFEPFYTTRKFGESTGLGLATVYGIVRQNNGFIDVKSEPGHGTTFAIYLPRHRNEIGRQQPDETRENPSTGQETILLLEDEPAVLKMTTRMLEMQGYIVLAARTPGRAIDLAREHEGTIDLLMTDVIMPEMNGHDLAKMLLAKTPGLKCLFMSGYTANVIVSQGIVEEGMNFIQKPFTAKGLATKVREVLAQ